MIAKMNEPLATDESTSSMPTAVTKRMLGTEASFAETALKLGGKSDEEVRRTGAMDKADELVESLFSKQHQTARSPIHRAVWDRSLSKPGGVLLSPRPRLRGRGLG
jgi:hypothetical protein